jgi:hypothetical protein
MSRWQPFEILSLRNTSQDILCDDRQEDNKGRHIQPCNKLIVMCKPDDGRKCGRLSTVLSNTTSTQSIVTTALDIWGRDLRQETVDHHGNQCCIVKGNRWSPALRCYQPEHGTLPPGQRASTVNEILFPAGKSLFLRSKRKHVKRCTTTV